MSTHGIDLLNDKSLWQIYRQCLLHLPPSKFNIAVTAISVLVLVIDAAYFPERHIERLVLLRSLADLGLGFGSTILGFLIAGFTIFATMSRPEMFRRMYETEHKKSGLSYFKVNFYAFVEVFVVYTTFLVLCLATKIFGDAGGIVKSITLASENHPINGYSLDKMWMVNSWFVIMGTTSLYTLVALKSFVFNTYHAVVTAVVWSFNQASNMPKH